MPCYTYKCSECSKEFEAFHMMGEKLEICSQAEDTNCEQSQTDTNDICEGKLIRLLSPVAEKKTIVSKTGDIVKKEIEYSKQRIEEAKKEFSKERKE